MAIRTKAQIARDMKAWLEARLRVVDTGQNTVAYSLMLYALAGVLDDANAAQLTAETAQGISDPASTDPDDLDDIAYNLSVDRKTPFAAIGFITFQRAAATAVNLRIGAEDGTGGVVVGTARDASGTSVAFVTTRTVFFTPSTAKDSVSGFYEVSAPIIAIQPGSSGNRDAGLVTALVSAVQGITSVTNKVATAGGKDRESNVDLASRMVSKLLGLQPGILEGLRGIAMAQNGVQDAAVVGPDDAELQRSAIGAVDLVVKGSILATGIDQFSFSGPTPWVLQNKPTTSIGSAVSVVGLTQGALLEGAQWSFSQDTVTEERFSTKANDQLSWVGSSLPNARATVTVTYTYDSIIGTIQGIVALDSEHYPSADVMVKRGQQVFLQISVQVTRTGSVDQATLANSIATAVSNYVAGLGLGAVVSQSVVVALIKKLAGVKSVAVPLTQFSRRNQSGAADVALTKYEYAAVDAQSISVSFTN